MCKDSCILGCTITYLVGIDRCFRRGWCQSISTRLHYTVLHLRRQLSLYLSPLRTSNLTKHASYLYVEHTCLRTVFLSIIAVHNRCSFLAHTELINGSHTRLHWRTINFSFCFLKYMQHRKTFILKMFRFRFPCHEVWGYNKPVPWRILHVKPITAQFDRLSAFYGILIFIILIIRTSHWTLSYTTCFPYTRSYSVSSRCFNVTLHPSFRLRSCFSHNTSVIISAMRTTFPLSWDDMTVFGIHVCLWRREASRFSVIRWRSQENINDKN